MGRELRISVPNAYFIFCKAECPQAPKLPSAFPCKRVEKRPATGRALGFTYCASLMAACAAARRAMGTRKGEQDT